MSYSRRQLESLGEPFGNDATRVKPGGYGRIYGRGGGGDEPASDSGTQRSGQYANNGLRNTAGESDATDYVPPDFSGYTPTSSIPASPYAGGFLGRTAFAGQMYNPFYEGLRSPDMVRGAYRNILGREPDTGGFNYYAGEMGRGLTGQGLVSRMTESPEFQRSQDYQRAYTAAFRPGYQEFGPSGQYYQPIYQGEYTNYARSPEFYQPSYDVGMMSPQRMGYGFGSFNPFSYGGMGGGFGGGFGGMSSRFGGFGGRGGGFGGRGGFGGYYAEGGEIEEDEGIAALGNR